MMNHDDSCRIVLPTFPLMQVICISETDESYSNWDGLVNTKPLFRRDAEKSVWERNGGACSVVARDMNRSSRVIGVGQTLRAESELNCF